MGQYDRIANLQNVGPGKVAIASFPLNCTYDKIKFKLGGGLVASKLTRIELKANDRSFFVTTGPRIEAQQAYKTITQDNAWVTIDFTEPGARNGAAQQFLSSIPANLLSKLTAEVTIDGTANANSTMECHVEFRPPTQNPFIRKLIDFNFYFAAAGDHDLILPSGVTGGLIKRVWMHSAGGLITGWDLRVDRVSARRQVQADWQFEQKQNGLTPQANLDVLDFVADGNLAGALNTAGNKGGQAPTVEFRVTSSAAESGTGYIEFIDPINRL